MEYEAIGMLSTPWLKEILLLASILGPMLMTWWNRSHIKQAADAATEAAQAVTPNHGSSLADTVNRIEKRITAIEDRLESHILTDIPCSHPAE